MAYWDHSVEGPVNSFQVVLLQDLKDEIVSKFVFYFKARIWLIASSFSAYSYEGTDGRTYEWALADGHRLTVSY